MSDTGDRTSKGNDVEDDLLRTIRQMVSDEAARPVKQPPSHLPPPPEEPGGGLAEAPAPAPTPPGAGSTQPLVLGAMARVGEGKPSAARQASAKPVDQNALRDMVQDAVREELDVILAETLGPRIRQLVRSELADYLARAMSDKNS